MAEKFYFLNMFSDYDPPEVLKNALSQAVICAADVDESLDIVSVDIFSDQYIPQRYLEQISKDVEQIYGLTALVINPRYPEDQLHEIERSELLAMFVRRISMNRATLAGAHWDWEDNTLVIRLKGNGKKDLKKVQSMAKAISEDVF